MIVRKALAAMYSTQTGRKMPKLMLSGLLLSAVLTVAGCTSSVSDPTPVNTPTNNTGAASADPSLVSPGFTLNLQTTNLPLREGEQNQLRVNIARNQTHTTAVNLALEGVTTGDLDNLDWQFTDNRIDVGENGTDLVINLNYDSRPIREQQRTVRIVATDGITQVATSLLTLAVSPTQLPDVYLLVGQSNMVGSSQRDAKQPNPGGADEPNSRIRQLNVTGNDSIRFSNDAAYTDPDIIVVPDPQFSIALDPLHEGFDTTSNGKAGQTIGLGLSFAKRALADTSTSIILVPAGWGDTGFCRRNSNAVPGAGWLAGPTTNPALSGSLLHDRAIARTNITLNMTGGILRGILWHQGESDSEDPNCAAVYEQNLRSMVGSFRTNIIQDARGASARGANADIPFIVGTMSKGDEFANFSETKLIVDGVHRNISSFIPFSASVNNDDLIPPNYPCGQGSCIHFGARALREMGVRYYDALTQTIP